MFISCTQEDLSAHADVVCEQVNRLGWIPVYQRLWSATGQPSVAECLARVRECQLLVVLVAHRYGWIPSRDEGGDDQRSITWLEADEARDHEIRVLPFLVDQSAEWPPPMIEQLANPGVGSRLAEFRAGLEGGLRAKFTRDPQSLAQPVYQALSEAGSKLVGRTHGQIGSVAHLHRPADVAKPSTLQMLLDRFAPGLLEEPPELADLQHYSGEAKAELVREIQEKLYVANVARSVPKSPFAAFEDTDPFVRPIQRVIRQIVGRSEGGDSASAQLAAVNRKSRVVTDLVHVLGSTREPVVLLGDPGTGKTMTLQQTALRLLEDNEKRVFPVLTVYVRLGEFHRKGPVESEHIWEFVRNAVPPEIAARLKALDRADRLVLIFDGMDEMSRDAYTTHTQALSTFAAGTAGKRTLFSCRVTDFSPAFIHHRLVLLPFDRQQIDQYFRLHFPDGVILDGARWSRKRLVDHVALGRTAFDGTNPFLLWLLCFHLHEKQAWPDSRVDLLHYYLTKNYERKAEEAAADGTALLDLHTLLFGWSQIAFVITSRNLGSAVSLVDLQRSAEWSSDELDGVVHAGRRCGVLIESKEGHARQVRFDNHRYQEFFTALYICNACGAPNDSAADHQRFLFDIPEERRPRLSIDWLRNLDTPRWQETMFNLTLMGGAREAIEILAASIEAQDAKWSRLREPFPRSATPPQTAGAPIELELADRVELAAQILQHSRRRADIEQALKPAVLSASNSLIEAGNPITQIKMIRAFMHVPDLDLLRVIERPLRSRVHWVRDQALILLSSTRRSVGANLPTEIGLDLASGVLLSRFGAYVRAIASTNQRGAAWSLVLGGFCALLGTAGLFAEALVLHRAAVALLRTPVVPEWLWSSGVVAAADSSKGPFAVGAVALGVCVLTYARKRPDFLWFTIPGGVFGSMVASVALFGFGSGHSMRGFGVLLAGAGAGVLAMWWFGALAILLQAPLLALYLWTTAGIRDPNYRWTDFAGNLRGSVLNESLLETSVMFNGIAATLLAVFGSLYWLGGALAVSLGGAATIVVMYTSLGASFWRRRKDQTFRRMVARTVWQFSLGIAILGVGVFLVIRFDAYLSRIFLMVLSITIGALSLWFLYQSVRALVYATRRQPFAARSLTVEQWKELVVQSDPERQQSLLLRTYPESLSLAPEQFLGLLRDEQERFAEEPALSTYWERRYELEEVMRQERRG